MAMLPFYLLLLIYVFAIPIHADTIPLTADVAKHIPSCAQSCMQSWVNAFYPDCTENGQFDCVCTTKGTSEYTIGEGAVQCITGEVKAGSCVDGATPSSGQIVAAYQMCNQPNALSNTHLALTATFEANPTAPTLLQIPTSSTTSSSSSSSSTNSASSSTTVPLPASALTASSSTTSSTSDPSGSAQKAAADSSQPLTKPQIIGIAVASVGGSALAIGAIIFILCIQKPRRKENKRDSDEFPQPEPDFLARSDSGFRNRGPGGTPDGVAARGFMPPIPTFRPQRPPRPSETPTLPVVEPDIGPSEDENTIGLAISELGGNAEDERDASRHASRLLPERPGLSLQVPGDESGTFGERGSVATTIDEEPSSGESGHNSWGARSTDRILSEISIGQGKLMTVNPNPAPPFLVTGGDGNHWRPGEQSENGTAKPEFYVKPLQLSKNPGSFSKPRKPTFDLSQFPAPPPVPNDEMTWGDRTNTLASSSYYGGDSLPASPPIRESTQREIPGESQAASYKPGNPWNPRQSGDSMTSFETVESDAPAPFRISKTLSPVAESPPGSGGGKSPVNYPFHLLPKRDSINATIRLDRPPQPDFTKEMSTNKPLKSDERAAMRALRMQQQQQQQQQTQQNSLQSNNPYPSAVSGQQPQPQPKPMPAPIERSETSVSTQSSGSGSYAKRKPADLKVDTRNDLVGKKKRQWKVVSPDSGGGTLPTPQKQNQELALTPTRRGDELYLSVQQDQN